MLNFDKSAYKNNNNAENDNEEKQNKPKIAVALSYNPGDEAPTVIATGKGVVAERIIEKAEDSEVPVYEDEKLAGTLSKLELGDAIPPELYGVVAEILVFVDKMDKIKSKVMK